MRAYEKMTNNSKAIEILRNYNGINPYILNLKKDIIVKEKINSLTDFTIEYILKNYNFTPKVINKSVKIADWYGASLQKKLEIEFKPEKIKIISFLGETKEYYHCIIKYRQNMEPYQYFLSKKGLLEDFLTEDYHTITVDFERYNNLGLINRPDIPRIVKPHQMEAVQFLLSRKKCILADDMGLGKSMSVSIASIEGNFDCVLVICPASLKTNWLEELSFFIPQREISVIGGITGLKKSELERYLGYGEGRSGKTVKELEEEAKERGKWDANRYVIVNYDILDEFYEFAKTRSKVNLEIALNNSPILQFVKGKKSLIIIDEAHKLSTMKSERFKIIKDLLSKGNPDSLYLVTGTPITNDPQNYYNLLSLLDAEITKDWNYYMQRYCGAKKFPKNAEEKEKRNKITASFVKQLGKNTWYDLTDDEKKELNVIVEKTVKMLTVPTKPTNLDELKSKTSHLYLRRTKNDFADLPSKTIHERYFDLTDEQKKEYDRLWEEYEELKLQEDPNNEINKELIEGALYRKYLSNQMVANTISLTDRCIAKGEKVVIACCYDEELYTLKEYYGDKCVVYNGKMTLKKKDEAKDAFIKDPNVMVFIGNITAAGVGITLINSRVLIFNNISWVPGDNQQMEDRIYRIGQKRDVHIYYQFFRNTQYEKMWNTVLKKSEVINQVIKKEDEK